MIPTTTLRAGPSSSTFTLRPGLFADIPSFARAYYLAFSDPRPSASTDNLLDILFGANHRDHQPAVEHALVAILAPRLWSLHYRMSALVDDSNNAVVGFVCIKRPDTEVTFYERWISPRTWLNRLCAGLYALATLIRRPAVAVDLARASAFSRAFAEIEPRVRCSPRRRRAWYLSIVAVLPELQGRGLGGGMLRAALDHVDEAGARQPLGDDGTGEAAEGAEEEEEEGAKMGGPAVWLTARKDTEALYRKFGFVKVMDSNTGPLSEWNGGAVMFRGLKGVEDRP